MNLLEDLLDQTREALLRGDFDALARLAPMVEAAAARPPGADAATASRLREKAARNGRLLQAAARGVKAARGRLAEITDGPRLSTYDARGRRADLVAAPQSLGRF
jgi:hypothetical protein